VVTFLFTDVEGSTRRWEADAQAMRAALVVHDKVLRTAIEAYDGFLFSHTGDGFVAAFASPMSAVSAAIDAQRELQFAGANGIGNRRGRAARRGLLRNGAQPGCKRDGRWTWWADPAGRLDGGSAQRG
jgi:class 3 adenylate cyclase